MQPGSLIAGKYTVIDEIGHGGMGVVYKAEDIKLKRCVALKFLPPHLMDSPELKERFLVEAQAAAALSHPNICVIHEVGESEDRPYIAMEYVEGETLRDRLRRGPLKTEEALDIAIQVAAGMGEAHNKGIIHRDIKSANIMITAKGQAKVMDFGLAKLRGGSSLTKSQTTLGTVAYMSPEQARGGDLDQKTDIWSLGVVLYEMIAGQLPFRGDHDQTVIYSILHHEPESLIRVRPGTAPELGQIVGQALTKKPADRYQTMEEFQEDLSAVAEGLKPLKARPARKIFGIKTAYAYSALAVVLALIFGLNVGGLRNRLIGGAGRGERVIKNLVQLEDDYQNFIRDAQSKLPQTFTLSQILKGQPQDFVSCEFKVPGSFTKAGWEDVIKQAIEDWSQIPEKESWILGQAQPVGPDLRDPKKRSAGLRELYFQEYSRNWWQFLRSIRYARFEDLSSASEALKILSDPKESPLKLILDAVARQTRFEIEPTSEGRFSRIIKAVTDKEKKKALKKVPKDAKNALGKEPPSSPKEELIQGINEEFAKLHSLSPATGGKEENPKELAVLLTQYATLKEKLQYIESDPGLKAKEVAAGVLEKQVGELPDAIKVIHTTLPESDFDAEARTALFEQPLRNVWGVILKEVQNGLNDVWRNNVYQLYTQSLASFYPFDPQGKDDAPMTEVARFFDPKEGIIGKFINEELKLFVKLDTWKSITWMDQGLSLLPPAVDALEKVEAIQALFEAGSLKVSFNLLADFPEPVGLKDEKKKIEIKNSIDQISLEIAGKLYPYRMGRPDPFDFSWPGTEGPLGARLTINSKKYNYEPIKSDGVWGWFRLLDKADITEVTPTECNIRWLFGQPGLNQVRIQYRLKTKSPFHPFRSTRDFFRLQLPESLISDIVTN
jgi:hypothetical protein